MDLLKQSRRVLSAPSGLGLFPRNDVKFAYLNNNRNVVISLENVYVRSPGLYVERAYWQFNYDFLGVSVDGSVTSYLRSIRQYALELL